MSNTVKHIMSVRPQGIALYDIVPQYAMYLAEHIAGEKPKDFKQAMRVIEKESGSKSHCVFDDAGQAQAYFEDKQELFTKAEGIAPQSQTLLEALYATSWAKAEG